MRLNELAFLIMDGNVEIVDIDLLGDNTIFKGNIIVFKRNKNKFKNYIVGGIFHNEDRIEIYVEKIQENEEKEENEENEEN